MSSRRTLPYTALVLAVVMLAALRTEGESAAGNPGPGTNAPEQAQQPDDTARARRDVRQAFSRLYVDYYNFTRHRWELPKLDKDDPTDPFPGSHFEFACPANIGGICVDLENNFVTPGGMYSIPAQRIFSPDALPGRNLHTPVHRSVNEANARISVAQRLAPADGWITEQRVWLLLEAGRLDPALHATMFCRAAKWHCTWLEAYVQHAKESYAVSDSLFQLALHGMPERERCERTDASRLLEGEHAKKYRAMSCAQRRDFEERLWWLADPLWSEPGNERRAEHHARLQSLRMPPGGRGLLDTLWKDMKYYGGERPAKPDTDFARSFEAVTLGSDALIEELIVRFGTPAYYFLAHPPAASPIRDPSTLAQYPSPRYQFLPASAAVEDPYSATSEDWEFSRSEPREQLVWPKRGFSSIEHQAGFFRRGSSARFVVATDINRDTLLLPAFRKSALVVQRGPREVPLIVRDSGRTIFRYNVDVPPEPHVASVEVIAIGRGAGRARFGAVPPRMPAQRVALSDLLLVAHSPTILPPKSLEQAAFTMLGTTRIATGTTVALYWELYGVTNGEVPTMTLVAMREPSGLVARARAALGAARVETSVRLRWQDEQSAGGEILARTITLDLSSLEPGSYVLQLTASIPGQEPVTVERPLEIVPRE